MAYLMAKNDGMSVCLSVCPSANVLKPHTKRTKKKKKNSKKEKREKKKEEKKKDPELELRVQILNV